MSYDVLDQETKVFSKLAPKAGPSGPDGLVNKLAPNLSLKEVLNEPWFLYLVPLLLYANLFSQFLSNRNIAKILFRKRRKREKSRGRNAQCCIQVIVPNSKKKEIKKNQIIIINDRKSSYFFIVQQRRSDYSTDD
jgi:hypothetical protein